MHPIIMAKMCFYKVHSLHAAENEISVIDRPDLACTLNVERVHSVV